MPKIEEKQMLESSTDIKFIEPPPHEEKSLRVECVNKTNACHHAYKEKDSATFPCRIRCYSAYAQDIISAAILV